MKFITKYCITRYPANVAMYTASPGAEVLKLTMELERYASRFSTTNNGRTISVIISIFFGL
jgi:hypothetical protein